MRLLKRETEGGLTLADWHGGFVGISRTGNGWRGIGAWYESCPCCKGAFDLTVEVLGIQFTIYNDGGPCELQAFYEDFEENAIPRQPYSAPQQYQPDIHLRPERIPGVSH